MLWRAGSEHTTKNGEKNLIITFFKQKMVYFIHISKLVLQMQNTINTTTSSTELFLFFFFKFGAYSGSPKEQEETISENQTSSFTLFADAKSMLISWTDKSRKPSQSFRLLS